MTEQVQLDAQHIQVDIVPDNSVPERVSVNIVANELVALSPVDVTVNVSERVPANIVANELEAVSPVDITVDVSESVLQVNSAVLTVRCGHQFHTSCITEWANQFHAHFMPGATEAANKNANNFLKCPSCKAKITETVT